MTLRPLRRRPLRLRHVGVVQTEALWFPADLGEAACRRRVLARWLPGATVARHEAGLLLRLPRPVPVDTRAAGSLPLLRVGGKLAAAPLHPADVRGAGDEDLLLLTGGQIRTVAASALTPEDPSRWLSLDDVAVHRVLPLGPPAAPPALALPVVAIDARERLGIGAAGAAAVADVVSALANRMPTGALSGAARALTGGLARGLGGLLRGAGAEGGGVGRFASALERWGQQLGLTGALQQMMSAQHARYFQQMLDRFAGSDLLEALRYAIPLSGMPSSGGSSGSLFGWLSPRGGLGFTVPSGGGGTLFAAPDLFELLRQVYRKAFATLDAQGRVREAAYVLAELLGEVEAALTYLEDRGEYALAAEIAESKQADPARVVLLWIRADALPRALALAQLHDVWAAAVLGLERRGCDALAADLRLSWARLLAATGRRPAAVEALWPVEALRTEAVAWLEDAIEGGGIGGAVALARGLALMPERAEDFAPAASRLLADEALDAPSARRTLVDLLAADPSAPAQSLSRALVRALVRDAEAAPSPEASQAVRTAADASRDGAIRADLPRLSEAPAHLPLARTRAPVTATVGPADTGTVAITDAVLLPRGRLLLALGALGARIVDLRGRTRVDFATPAHRLIPTPDGEAVLLAARGADGSAGGPPLWRLSRVDPLRRRCARWCDAALDDFADTFDGGRWFVAEGDRLTAIDPVAPTLRALWRVSELAARPLLGRADLRIVALRHHPDQVVAWVPDGPAGVEGFHYQLPGLTLRQRVRLAIPVGATVTAAPEGVLAVTAERGEHVRGPTRVSVFHPPAGERLIGARSAGALSVFTTQSEAGAAVHVVTTEQAEAVTRARLRFDGSRAVGVRAVGGPPGLLLMWDELGRLRALGTDDGRLHADLRIRG